MDLDGDGKIDLLSGSWPGELFFFRGKGRGQFDAAIKLKDKDGKTINIGGGVHENSPDGILVDGDARFEKTDKGHVILYEGKRIAVPEGKQALIGGTASAVHAVDWDGDGKLDLLVGEIGGSVYLVPNEGTARRYAFGKERPLLAGGKPVRVEGDAGPFTADWDGDSRVDLLVGSGDGSVWFYRNTGSRKKPELAEGIRLIPPAGWRYRSEDAPRKPSRGIRAKVCAVDWNGDGRLDLLVGDFSSRRADRPEPTPGLDRLRKQIEAAGERYRQLSSKLEGPSRLKSKVEREKLEKELQAVEAELHKLQARWPRPREHHGWVWLYLRTPAEKTAHRP